MINKINEVLVNNAGQRLTPELINGMAHSIRVIVEEEEVLPASDVEEDITHVV